MKARALSRAGAALLFASASAVTSNAHAVVAGTVDTSRPDVLLLQDDTLAGFRCTATLIAPNLVITARHCVGKRSTGSTLCRGGATDEGAQSLPTYQGDVEAAPMYFSAAPGAPLLARGKTIFDDGATTTCAHDLALIELDRVVAGITPAQLRRTPPAVNDSLVVMGFGWTDRNATVNATQRMKGTTSVLALGATVYSFKPFGDAAMNPQPLAVAAGEIAVGGLTMTGDSGGPAFDAAGRIAALVSRGYADAYYGPGTFTTLAAHLPTIDAALAATGNAVTVDDAGADAAPAPGADAGGDSGSSGGSGGGDGEGDADAGTDDASDATATDASSDGSGCATSPAKRGDLGTSGIAAVGSALSALVLLRARRRGLHASSMRVR